MRLKILILSLFILPIAVFAQVGKSPNFLSEKDRTFVIIQRTDAKTQAAKSDWKKRTKPEEIVFVLRMPPSWTKEKNAAARESKTPCVRGLLAICTWDKDTEKLKRIVSSDESSFKHLLRFADENNLAVITWQNFGGYLIATSSDEMTEKQSKDYDFMFNDRLSEWENGYRRVLHKFTLPQHSAMIYVFSGGGQSAHRIALRKPQYFSGIHIHVNSSYDTPTLNAKNIVWLVTTGELEYGYSAATRFYQKMIDLGYAVIFKAGENLGHATNAQINNLSLEFFKYMINFVPDPSNPDWKTPPVDKFYLLRHPIYVGDYLNQVAYPIEKAIGKVADRKYMVTLPTKPIAQAWGTIIEK